jgi:hypothetical protein
MSPRRIWTGWMDWQVYVFLLVAGGLAVFTAAFVVLIGFAVLFRFVHIINLLLGI